MVKYCKLLITLLFVAGLVTLCGNANENTEIIPPPDDKEEDKGDDGGKEGNYKTVDLSLEIPLYGNTYLSTGSGDVKVEREGITGWNSSAAILSVYFKVENSGELNLALYGKSPGGKSTIKASVGGTELTRSLHREPDDTVTLGTVNIAQPGYVELDLQGVSRQGSDFGTYTHLWIGGKAAEGKVVYVPGYEDNWGYWGRRGPSVHMNYTLPAQNVTWFYNEVTVPEGNDVTGSYFMTNGFGQGYMGIQVNSATERRVLFSVWSPYETDNPNDIPEEDRVVLLKKGEGVTVRDFGNEGSGGQSYLVYMWKPAHTYRVLTRVAPTGSGSTDYTGYFCDHDGRWRLIASFRRPKTDTHYTGAHSFLENFSTSMGDTPREVRFDNQWARTASGQWVELTAGRFTCDNTGRQGYRVDYDGGAKDGGFYLRNCGFFNETMAYGSNFTRPAKGVEPDVDLEMIERL